MNSVAPVRIWISQLKEGDPVAAQQLWDIYFGRMVKAARLKLHGAPGRIADEEDVALSAFKSFCRGTRDGRFPQRRPNCYPGRAVFEPGPFLGVAEVSSFRPDRDRKIVV